MSHPFAMFMWLALVVVVTGCEPAPPPSPASSVQRQGADAATSAAAPQPPTPQPEPVTCEHLYQVLGARFQAAVPTCRMASEPITAKARILFSSSDGTSMWTNGVRETGPWSPRCMGNGRALRGPKLWTICGRYQGWQMRGVASASTMRVLNLLLDVSERSR